jgi:DNA-binding LacI/PurR family transcriptional regulator
VDLIFAGEPVTAILTINEEALSGVLFALGERGLRVPDDISVLAVASSRVATAVHPQVSAAEVPAEQMGRQAVETLLHVLASASAPRAHILLSPPFEDRGSVAAPRHSQAPASPGGGLAAPLGRRAAAS